MISMIDGEGIGKDRWRGDPFDRFFPGRGNDSDGDASSNYSSCEGSDLERYCSANSALGSASVCSSVENYRDILDSCKTLSGFGEDLLSDGGGGGVGRDKLRSSQWNRDATTSGGAVGCLLDEKDSSPHLLPSGGMNSSQNLVSSVGMRADGNEISATGSRSDPLPAAAQDSPVSGEDWSAQEVLGAEGDGRNSGELACDNPMRSGTAAEADEEHSEDEDSTLDSGTDDDGRSGIFLHDRHSFRHAEETKNNENPLIMNSSVAFGSNDWDGFVQETGDGGLTYLSSCGGQPAWQSLAPSETEGTAAERYRSAILALGSTGICSSVRNYHDLLDSYKNLSSFGEDLLSDGGSITRDKLGRSHWNGDATTSGGGVDCSLDGKDSSSHLLSSCGMNSSKNLVSSEAMHADSNGISATGNISDPLLAAAQDLPVSGEDYSAQEVLGAEDDGRNSGELFCDNPMRSGTAVEADEEHSEGEDSMLDSGTDDEGRSGIFLHDRHSFRHAEETKNIENPLIMNSSVAFGSHDWDGFVQETGDGGLTYLSSCGGQPAWQSLAPSETEGTAAERYCSANLALGSTGICSSVKNYHDLLDSYKNISSFGEDLLSDGGSITRDKLGRSHWNGDATTSGGGVDCSLDGKDSSSHLLSSCGMNSSKNLVSSEAMHADSNGISATGNISDPLLAAAQDLPVSGEDYSAQEVLGAEDDGRNSGELFCDNPMRSGTAVEADEEHSEGEDSMLDSGTDDEGRSEIFLHDRHSFRHAEETKNNENPLIMNSSVAFGSHDWDGFVQETGDDGLTYLSFCGGQPAWQSLGPSETEGNISLLSTNHVIDPLSDKMEQEKDASDLPAASIRLQVAGLCNLNERTNSVGNPLGEYEVLHAQKPLSENNSAEGVTDLIYDGGKGEISSMHSEVVAVIDVDGTPPEGQVFGESDTHSDVTGIQFFAASRREFQGKESGIQDGDEAFSFLSIMVINGQDSGAHKTLNEKSKSVDMVEDDLVLDEVKNLDANDLYDELVLEMEDILLDSRNSHGTRFTLPDSGCIAQQSYHLRDDSSTASTSDTADAYPIVRYPSKIDRLEVVGAKQMKGDVSFGERLVGVKEHTLYILKVWSGKDQWEVERRYRDFHALYRQLRILFTERGLALPSPWSNVERQSRKIFGNASPNIVSERTMLIQDCLHSILNSIPLGTPSPLVCFLTPGKVVNNPSLLKALIPQSLQKAWDNWNLKVSNCGETVLENVLTLGKTISLVVEIKPRKSTRQLLESQHYTCAGCHTRLDAGKTLLGELVQTLRWNKPRFCEYTGQLFCASCHTNDSAVLPARVLNLWDFSLYPISQLAKAYLESIYDRPMLCVSAVNPLLFSKVPALLHVMGCRKKIGAMLPFVCCPFRRSIQIGLGCRRHLLESNDFFALRDLVDLSKGPFAGLPVLVETISNRILEHITQQCLVCCDAGVPCAAREACNDPSSLIFPFQEAEAARCGSCGFLFHQLCFQKLMGCPCGKPTGANRGLLPAEHITHGAGKDLEGVMDGSFQPSSSNSMSGFSPNILSKARPDEIWKPRNSNPVILVGSLPSISL